MTVTLPSLAAAVSAITFLVPAERSHDLSGDGAPHIPGHHLYQTGGDSIGSAPVFIPPAAGAGGAGGNGGGQLAASPATTTLVVNSLREASRYCGAIAQKSYVVDCLAERLEDVNRRMAATDGYSDVRDALTQATRGLNQIAMQNRSATQPSARFRQTSSDGAQITTSRKLVPVAPEKQEAAILQAIAIIEETETVLLRSAESSSARAAQFQRIAAAVGSNKVLLRSL